MSQKYGYQANGVAPHKPCLVCDDPQPHYSWTDVHGEGYCTRCGTPYQLKAGLLGAGDTYPRCNILPEFIEELREYWSETNEPNGLGTFMVAEDYRDQIAARRKFNAWADQRHPNTEVSA